MRLLYNIKNGFFLNRNQLRPTERERFSFILIEKFVFSFHLVKYI